MCCIYRFRNKKRYQTFFFKNWLSHLWVFILSKLPFSLTSVLTTIIGWVLPRLLRHISHNTPRALPNFHFCPSQAFRLFIALSTVSCLTIPDFTEVLPTYTVGHYGSANWEDLREFICAFSWRSVCFADQWVIGAHITEFFKLVWKPTFNIL